MQNTPQAHLCVKKNRVKMYSDKVYLKDKQEFEFELYNPTQFTQLAKIHLNGKAISTSGIVLKPGQRVYLERFIDNPQKFKFETYEVDGSSTTQKAIAQNGLVRVEFYQEYVPNPPLYSWSYGTVNIQPTMDFFCSTSDSTGGQKMSASLTSTRSCKGQSMDAQLKEFVETGRVEKGNTSNQQFSQYTGEFNSWTSSITTFTILPVSAKPLEGKDLILYCTQCGAKQKETFQFCPVCGNKH